MSDEPTETPETESAPLVVAARPRRKPPGKKRGQSLARVEKCIAFADFFMGAAKMNAATAAKMLGHKGKPATLRAHGWKWLHEAATVERIAEIKAERAAKQEDLFEMISGALRDLAAGGVRAPLGIHEGGPVFGPPKHSDRIRALAELAELHGLKITKIEAKISAVPASSQDLRDLADERERVEALERQLTLRKGGA